MNLRDVAPLFHGHLDVCERCRLNPFDLCAQGARLLEDEGRKLEEEVARAKAAEAGLHEALEDDRG